MRLMALRIPSRCFSVFHCLRSRGELITRSHALGSSYSTAGQLFCGLGASTVANLMLSIPDVNHIPFDGAAAMCFDTRDCWSSRALSMWSGCIRNWVGYVWGPPGGSLAPASFSQTRMYIQSRKGGMFHRDRDVRCYRLVISIVFIHKPFILARIRSKMRRCRTTPLPTAPPHRGWLVGCLLLNLSFARAAYQGLAYKHHFRQPPYFVYG